ncbi:hypothetical protein CRG98_038017, partial [Punica granatum]
KEKGTGNSHGGDGGHPFKERSAEGQAPESGGAVDERLSGNLQLIVGTATVSGEIGSGPIVGFHGQVLPIPPHFRLTDQIPSISIYTSEFRARKSNSRQLKGRRKTEDSGSRGRTRRMNYEGGGCHVAPGGWLSSQTPNWDIATCLAPWARVHRTHGPVALRNGPWRENSGPVSFRAQGKTPWTPQ